MELTHLDETGAARMVDVGEKAVTRRTACAQSVKEAFSLLDLENELDTVDKSTIISTLRCSHKTGIEMEALTAASIAALTIYDMCKAVDRGMRIDQTLLLHKDGGRSGEYSRTNE